MNEKIGQVLMVGLPVLAVGTLIFFGWPRHEIMKVQTTEWTRQIAIEELRTVKKYNRRSVPSGGRIFNVDWERDCHPIYMMTTTKNGGTNRIKIGESCTSYQEYDFEIEEFVESRWVKANGMFGSDPRWPEFKLANGTLPYGVGQERKGVSRETYTVFVVSQEKGQKEWTTNQSTWKTFEPSQIVDATFTFGSVSNLEHLEKH